MTLRDVRVGQRVMVQHDVGVIRADVLGHVVHVRDVQVGWRSLGLKFSAWSTKSTAKLRTGMLSSRVDSAVIALESRPPDSNTHWGTSATNWRRTMPSSNARTRATVVSRSSVCSRDSNRQYVRSLMPRSSTVTTVPGSTSLMPCQMACPGVLIGTMISRIPSTSTMRLAIGLARIALGSEPNNTPSGVG